MLRGWWKSGGWSESSLPAAARVVDSGFASTATGARGASPADGLLAVGFRSSLVAIVHCGPFQSLIAMGLMGFRLAMGLWRSIPAAAAVRRRRNLEHRGSRDLVVFSHFLWTFVQFVWWCRCPLYPAKMYLYLYCYLYHIF